MNLSLRPAARPVRRVAAPAVAMQPVRVAQTIAVIAAGALPGAPVS
jgi:hypothetical protein